MPEAPFDQILSILLGLNIWQVVKGFLLLGILLYLVFAVVIIRQINLMFDALEVELEWVIKFVAWLHLFLVIGMFVFGIISL